MCQEIINYNKEAAKVTESAMETVESGCERIGKLEEDQKNLIKTFYIKKCILPQFWSKTHLTRSRTFGQNDLETLKKVQDSEVRRQKPQTFSAGSSTMVGMAIDDIITEIF